MITRGDVVSSVAVGAAVDLAWFGFSVPAKTPTDIVERLNNAIQAVLHSEEAKSGMENLAVEIDAISMDDLARQVASETERWKRSCRQQVSRRWTERSPDQPAALHDVHKEIIACIRPNDTYGT